MMKWKCLICGYIYEGEELPADFVCPICKQGADKFVKIEDTPGDKAKNPYAGTKSEKNLLEPLLASLWLVISILILLK